MTSTDWMIAMGVMLILPVSLIPISLLMMKLGRGFNTFSRAALTREAQIFAARTCGGMLLRIGIIMTVIILAGGGIGLAFIDNETLLNVILWIVIGLSLILVLIPVILTELAVRKRFDKDGKPYK